MQKHLDAVSNRDLSTLKSTLSPKGNMQLILPSTEIINSVDSFMNYHETWFQDTSAWTFDTEILNTMVTDDLAIAITQIVYREPERDGKPYFNRMTVSYGLQKYDGEWYVIKDHASSVEKSTDRTQ
ncbi:MAG: nuclear transport factor 2 family protein [Bacteroidota bacterium]